MEVGGTSINTSEEATVLQKDDGNTAHDKPDDVDLTDKVNKLEVEEIKCLNENDKTEDESPSRDLANGTNNVNNVETEESDGEIVDSDVDDSQDPEPSIDYGGLDDVRPEFDQLDYDEDVDEGEVMTSQENKLDKKEEKKEMSDGEIESSDGEVKSEGEENVKTTRHETSLNEYEEGEMVDPIDGPAAPREICRFYQRGSCTWGERCRFIHPGINDKGGYNMFADALPTQPHNQPIKIDPRGPLLPPGVHPGIVRAPQPETAWERGLRHAKEMRRRAMQRKVEEPDFMRKREVISLNEALNVDRDMDYIAHKPLVEDDRGFDPFNALDEDDRYAVPPPEEIKRYKRFEKKSREDTRSPNSGEIMRRGNSPLRHGRIDKDQPRILHDRRRSPPRHPGLGPLPPDRHQPPPMPHRPPIRHEAPYRDHRGDPGRHERDYRRMDDAMDRDRRSDRDRNIPPDGRRGSPQRRRDIESRVVPVAPSSGSSRNAPPRGDNWNDPWARGRQGGKGRSSRSRSDSSGSSSSSSSRSSYSSRSGSSYSSRSSSRSSYSSSFSSLSRSPSPKKMTKKLVKKKKVVPVKAKSSPKIGKSPIATIKQVGTVKKLPEVGLKEKQTKPPQKPTPPVAKPATTPNVVERGRSAVKTKKKPRKKSKSSSSEFSHSSSSESRSRSKGKGSDSDSDSGSSSSSSGSESYSSSSSISSSDEEITKRKPVNKKSSTKSVTPSAGEKKAIGKISVPSKPGRKDVKMTINKVPAKSATTENRKRNAAAMSNPGGKKVSAIANRRVELLEQLKVVENAILKKRAKLT